MIFHFQTELKINKPVDEVFLFFSKAENLEQLTPSWLHFQILTALPIEMKAGALIDYRITLYKIPIFWRTEITLWDPAYRFVDSQIKGPYKKWIHEHTFMEVEGGCLITDKVQYQLYAWILSPIIDRLFVRKEIKKIFNYRMDKIKALFS